ncbi:diphthamide biosynthesis protein [Tothia fuscella]|uniref:2-(3-amino-3-carboxypropyl)histidine synthase subunit 2 n=1 Tax=Tothia fuscella TaxID=1048955 RepID=A0A9P4NJG8_9PEZI|nr:diphthamide biosynthesis protein [Tothia fuscella]
MANPALTLPPVLSTPESHVFEDPTLTVEVSSLPRLSDEQIAITYEIERTVREIREGGWRRVALQFPDEMLVDAVRVYGGLRGGLRMRRGRKRSHSGAQQVNGEGEYKGLEKDMTTVGNGLEKGVNGLSLENGHGGDLEEEVKLCILADTSYGACCVDEIAADHVDAEVVVHYGRSCLSPTARLPVIYVFTEKSLDIDSTVDAFKTTYPKKDEKVVLMADIPYCTHISNIHQRLKDEGYTNVFATEVLHNPSSALPNRTVPEEVGSNMDNLQAYAIFHLGPPPTALLLTLSSRVSSVHILDPTSPSRSSSTIPLNSSSAALLRRRYALLTTLATVPIFGILINTLSVRNYLSILKHIQDMISSAGKKYYTFVVGKVNAAKVGNFAEVGGWVVVGCWESSLVEGRDFYRPVVTPYELGVALMGDGERVWGGRWRSDFEGLLEKAENRSPEGRGRNVAAEESTSGNDGNVSDEEDSAPPEFDLRTGRYISHTRPMALLNGSSPAHPSASSDASKEASTSLIKRANGDVAQIGGVVSPGAEFLKSKRTWQGLGSDFEIAYENEGGLIEEGRSGVARGYSDGTDGSRR